MTENKIYSAAFEKSFKKVLGFEGDFSNDKYDSGGATRWGCTIAEARRHGYQGDMREFPLELAKKIFFDDYWNANSCEEIAKWNYECADELNECSINMGVKTAAIMFQRAINLFLDKEVTADGSIGPKTLAAMQSITADNKKKAILKAQNVLQGARYIAICENNPTQKCFIRGWLKRTEL